MSATDMDGVLGMYDSEKKTIIINEENTLNFTMNPHKHIIPKNKDKIEKKYPSLVLVWGDESEQEILTKILSFDDNKIRIAIFMTFYSCINVAHPERIKNVALSLKSSYPEAYKILDKTDVTSKFGIKESGCFIATATLGDYNHPVVLDLRKFRDDYLLKNIIGKIFVKIYYNLSPSLSKFISKYKLLRILSLNLLITPLHRLIKKIF